MKKSLFFYAAATALMLTACSSEDDILQTGPEKKAAPQEVGFDVYTPATTNVTRAGLTGTMTTSRLQRSEAKGGGFGVYAFLSEGTTSGVPGAYSGRTKAIAPNFMVNEKLLWNSVNQGWYYNPLKYWPNETDNDSQNKPATMQNPTTKNTDNLTFFAYAPYVSNGVAGVPGIMRLTDQNGRINTNPAAVSPESYISLDLFEPSIQYMASLDDPNKAVDLLWGVAPAGGLSYTAVNGNTVTVNEGEPLIDMTKPNVNTNMKFLFQHALARIGLKAVAAIDQVGAGGTLDPNTKITIKSITLTGYFGETGILNLDNTKPSVANWTVINGTSTKTGTFTDPGVVGTDFTKTTITISGNTIAEHLRAVGDHDATPDKQESSDGANDRVGVTTVKQDVLEPITVSGANADWYSTVTPANNTTLKYSETTPYYTDPACTTKATTLKLDVATGRYYTLDENGVYTQKNATGLEGRYASYTYPQVMKYYDVTFKMLTAADVTAGTYATYTAYALDKTAGGDNDTWDDGDTFTPKADVPVAGDFVITASELKVPYYAAGTYYKRDASYFMVVPTNNIAKVQPSLSAEHEEALRTVTVTIDYYITTEDSKLAAGRAQTENIITKDVVFPSIANGKSYNLNLILGLTSVKMEAEVDDWKVINVQGDLPQNTAD